MTFLTVFKHSLEPGTQRIRMPKGAELLSVAMQHGTPQLYFLCDPAAEKEDRIIVLTGTGHAIENVGKHKFIGTMSTDDQNFVFHVFERVSAW